jgi:hypothetical protein
MRRGHVVLALGAVALLAVGVAAGLLLAGGGESVHRAVAVNQSHTDASVDKDVQVFCPKGYAPVGGGGIVPHGNDTPGVALYWSAPYQNGWEVAAQDTRRKTIPWVLTAYVVCVKPAIEDEGLPGSTLTIE